MAHYAHIDENNIVDNVLVIDKNSVLSGAFGLPDKWIKTSYNTREGIYYTPNTDIPDPDQSKALRKNYAQIGYTYDPERDAFIPQKPAENYILDEFSCTWKKYFDP